MNDQNVVFIVVDDLNSWIGALGRNPDVKTPNIDTLASKATNFSKAYCSAPYCNASRMGLFTGQLPHENLIYGNEKFWQRTERPRLIFETLRSAGIYTIGAGKVMHGVYDYVDATRNQSRSAPWLEKYNRSSLWDEFRAPEAEPLPEFRPINGLFDFSDFEAIPKKYHGFDWGPIPDSQIELMPDTLSINFLGQRLQAGLPEPFFCAAGLYKPHLPWHVPQRFYDLYEREHLSLPFVKEDDLEDVPPIPRQWVNELPDHELVTSAEQWRHAVHGYLASISFADYQVGRLVEAVEASPHAHNTTIILCSDNGFHLGEKLHWRKFVLWEEATQVPLLIYRLGDQPKVIDAPVSLIDVYPTLLELFGLKAPFLPNSRSLLPSLAGMQDEHRPPVVTSWGRGNHSLRSEYWRYTVYRDGGAELYDHRIDPYEWTNLIATPAAETIASKLKKWLPNDLQRE